KVIDSTATVMSRTLREGSDTLRKFFDSAVGIKGTLSDVTARHVSPSLRPPRRPIVGGSA
ncbi:MAG: hypothetical protein ACSLE6_13075, partial [Mycobacterium sp.]